MIAVVIIWRALEEWCGYITVSYSRISINNIIKKLLLFFKNKEALLAVELLVKDFVQGSTTRK